MKRIKRISLILSVMLMVLTLSTGIAATEATSSWDGTTITQPSSMKMIDGVYYYEISSAEELAYIAKTGGDWLGYNYVLTDDIILNSVELTYDSNGDLTVDTSTLNQWTPIDGFTGIFKGNGHAVSGVYVNDASYAGFFAYLKGKVYDLTVKNSYIKGQNGAGGICSGSYEAVISECEYYGAVVGNCYVGGIAGSLGGNNDTNLASCVNYGDIWATGNVYGVCYAGGIVGLSYVDIISCTNYGNIQATGSVVGGIAGCVRDYIYYCANEGNVYSTGDNIGGIAGECDRYDCIIGCFNKGNITGNDYVGGVLSRATGCDVSDCGNTGNITGANYVGGVCGYASCESGYDCFGNCYNTGTISGSDYVGGIVGYMTEYRLDSNYNAGKVIGATNVGGIAGYSDSVWGRGSVSDCYYLKSDAINSSLNGFGNADDVEGITDAKDDSFFCVNSDKTLNKDGHTFDLIHNGICSKCGYEHTHTAPKWSFNDDMHWHECAICTLKFDQAKHTLDDDGSCNDCGTNCYVKYGKTGDLDWYFDSRNGKLKITGEGDMPDYGYNMPRPFGEFADKILSVDISDGITSIGSNVFFYCTSLTSITIPDGVTSIGSEAFRGCTSLTNITIPEGVTSIGSGAFCWCESLTSITLPESLTRVGSNAFAQYSTGDCWLEKVYFNGDIDAWLKITFDNSYSNPCINGAKLYFNGKLVTNVTIPDGVTGIGNYAFYGCGSITSVTFGKDVSTIGYSAFVNCSKIHDYTFLNPNIPISGLSDNSATVIGGYKGSTAETYANDRGYVFYLIRDDLEYSGSAGEGVTWAFDPDTGVLTIAGDGRMTDYTVAASPWFGHRNGIRSVVIESGVKYVGAYSFAYLGTLESIKTESGLSEIGNHAFMRCSCLTKVELSDDLKTIGTGTFYACTALESIVLPDELRLIDASAFERCSALKDVKFGSRLREIGENAFSYCSSLEVAELPDDLRTIGEYAFYYCTEMTTLTIPEKVGSIGHAAFYECHNVSKLYFNSTRKFDFCLYPYDASNNVYVSDVFLSFGYKNGFTLVVGENVKHLPAYMFATEGYFVTQYCKEIIFLGNKLESIGCHAFEYAKIENLVLPEGLKSIGEYAFYGCQELKSVTIPESVSSIGAYAFGKCTEIEELHYNVKNKLDFDFDSSHIFADIGSDSDGVCVYLGKNVTHVPANMFCSNNNRGRQNVVKVVFEGNSVDSIGDRAFSGCFNLKSIKLPHRLTEIGSEAFADSGLTSISIPKGVTYIGTDAFENCFDLEKIVFRNADIVISDSNETIFDGAVIYGYSTSTAKDWADKYDREFRVLNEDLKINSASLSLAENIEVNYYATVPDGLYDPYMVFEFNGVKTVVRDYTFDSRGRLKFIFPNVYPQMLGDNISATLYATSTVDDEVISVTIANFSARQYCVTMLNNTSDESLKKLICDLLVYGEKTQLYRNYKTDALITDGIDITPSVFEKPDSSCNKFRLDGVKDTNINFSSVSLVLGSDITLKLGIKSADPTGYTFKISIGDNLFTYDADDLYYDGKYYLDFKGIKAAQFDEDIVATIWDGDTQIGQTLTYSVNTYIMANQNVSNENLRELLRAMCNYGRSAYAYKYKN